VEPEGHELGGGPTTSAEAVSENTHNMDKQTVKNSGRWVDMGTSLGKGNDVERSIILIMLSISTRRRKRVFPFC